MTDLTITCTDPNCLEWGNLHPVSDPDDLSHINFHESGNGWDVIVESSAVEPRWTVYSTINYQQSDTVNETDVLAFLVAHRRAKARAKELLWNTYGTGAIPERQHYIDTNPIDREALAAAVGRRVGG